MSFVSVSFRKFHDKLSMLLILLTLLWIGNTSLWFDTATLSPPLFLSHRGVHQIYTGGAPVDDTCTASPVRPISHGFIENTIPSMRAAFEAGADVVELDVHLTQDGVFAVFHDWTLDCRTDGAGQTNQALFSDLQMLDAAYGYTADGMSFPLRGNGVGLIPSLTEVFDSFPEKQF